MTEQVTKNIKD